MNTREFLDHLANIREKSETNKLVVFVGAGVSKNVGEMPSWHDLVYEMAKVIGYEKCDYCCHRTECLKKDNNEDASKCPLAYDYSADEYIKIPQYVFNKSEQDYNDVINNCISKYGFADSPLSKAIFNLNPSHIITTNYDKLLESSESVYCKQYDVIIEDKDLLDSTQSKYIIKMHGDISRPETIVLKEQDYLEYSQKHVLIELFVKALLADHTILFLGYSLNDYNIKLIISWINYLRFLNKTLLKDKRRKIGYIILDEEKEDKNSTAYFQANNIEVVNIHSLPISSNVPELIKYEKGKRLYSFLEMIVNGYLEDDVLYNTDLKQTIKFLLNYEISDYRILLKILNISSYSKEKEELIIYRKEDFDRLAAFFNENSESAENLKQLLVNVGIKSVLLFDAHQEHKIEFPDKNNYVLENKFFKLYIQNQYDELLSLCQRDVEHKITSCFYQHFAIGYDDIESNYESINFEKLSENEQVVYLHNRESLNALKNFNLFVSTVPSQFINNMSLSKKRLVFQPFLNMYNGEKSDIHDMESKLSQLKKDVDNVTTVFLGNDGPISKIYSIQNMAYAHYLFYHSNHIFTVGNADVKAYMKPYIEAMICANKDNAERHKSFHGIEGASKKYEITTVDFDIISKYINTKELAELLKLYEISRLKASFDSVQHIVLCFVNLVNSLVTSQTFGYRDSSIKLLSNLSLLLSKLDLSNENKLKLSSSMQRLFSLDTFNRRFWSIHCTDFGNNIQAFASLLELLLPCTNINCIKSIIGSPGFFDFISNVNFFAAKSVIRFFICKEDYSKCQVDLFKIIDNSSNFDKKVLLLQIFYKTLLDGPQTNKLKIEMSKNFSKLSNSAVYDFVFSGWISVSAYEIRKMLDETLSLYHSQNEKLAVYSFPNPLDNMMERIYILYLNKTINKLSALEIMCDDFPHLDFILHPDSFDYSKIDFLDYMWQNFAYQHEYMEQFIAHKADIVPRIKEHINTGEASEFEKKILYGFLLEGDDILKAD